MQSPTITKLITALLAAQKEFKPLRKKSENPYFHSFYCDLFDYIEATKEALAKNGLVMCQIPIIISSKNAIDTQVTNALETTLIHSSGEWISSQYLLNPIKNDPQANGAALTYARRYSMGAMLNLAADDDDGNTANAILPPQKVTTPRNDDQNDKIQFVGARLSTPTKVLPNDEMPF